MILATVDQFKSNVGAIFLEQYFCVSIKDRPGSLFQPGPGPGPGSAKNAGTGILPGPGL